MPSIQFTELIYGFYLDGATIPNEGQGGLVFLLLIPLFVAIFSMIFFPDILRDLKHRRAELQEKKEMKIRLQSIAIPGALSKAGLEEAGQLSLATAQSGELSKEVEDAA